MSWEYKKPRLPALHKCTYCGKRLSRKDDTVVDCYLTFDSLIYDWFCSKECARGYNALWTSLKKKLKELEKYIDGYSIEQHICTTDEGTELYEGDIIRWLNSTGREITAPIVWDDRALCYMAGGYMLGGLMGAGVKVVGNTHNVSELLEAKK